MFRSWWNSLNKNPGFWKGAAPENEQREGRGHEAPGSWFGWSSLMKWSVSLRDSTGFKHFALYKSIESIERRWVQKGFKLNLRSDLNWIFTINDSLLLSGKKDIKLIDDGWLVLLGGYTKVNKVIGVVLRRTLVSPQSISRRSSLPRD